MENMNNKDFFWKNLYDNGFIISLLDRYTSLKEYNKVTISLTMALECSLIYTLILYIFSIIYNTAGLINSLHIGKVYLWMLCFTALHQFGKKSKFEKEVKITVLTLSFLVIIFGISYIAYLDLNPNNDDRKEIINEPPKKEKALYNSYQIDNNIKIKKESNYNANTSSIDSNEDWLSLQQIKDLKDQVDKEYGDMFKKMNELLRMELDDDWEKFMVLVDNTTAKYPELMPILLINAIQKDAPTDVLIELINRGAEFASPHVSSLAQYKSIDEIKVLEDYGINFNQLTHLGGPLISSTFNDTPVAVFDYLINRGAPVIDSNVDILQKMLERSESVELPPYFVHKMLEHGAELTPSHRQWLSELKKRNPDYYNKLALQAR